MRTVCNLCPARCPLLCTVEDGRIAGIKPDANHPMKGVPCLKGLSAAELVYNSQRLKYPLLRIGSKDSGDPSWKRITWDDALDLAAEKLKEIRGKYGAESILFTTLTGSGPAGDYNAWSHRLANAFGSPNIISTVNVCQWNREYGSIYTLGAATPAADFRRSDTIVVWGHDPTNSNPSQAKLISDARSRGARLIVVDPRLSGLAARDDHWLQVLPGTDGALALGLINQLLENDGFDRDFLSNWTNAPFLIRKDTGALLCESDMKPGVSGEGAGEVHREVSKEKVEQDKNRYVVMAGGELHFYDPRTMSYDSRDIKPELLPESDLFDLDVVAGGSGRVKCETVLSALRGISSKYTPEKVEEVTTVPRERLISTAKLISDSKKISYWFWNGIQQHSNGFQASRAITILFALRGCLDKPGGNVFFNSPDVSPVEGREFLPLEANVRRLGIDRFPAGPPKVPGNVPGYVAYNAILTGRPYAVKGMVAFGGNILMSNGDSYRGREALRKLEFFMISDLFMSPTAEQADLVLPATSFLEDDLLATWKRESTRHVQLRRPVVQAVGEAWPDMKIILTLANKLGMGDKFWNGSVRDAIDYMIKPLGIDYEQLRGSDTGYSFTSETIYDKYEKVIRTPSRRIEIYSVDLYRAGFAPLPEYVPPTVAASKISDYPLILVSRKILPFFQSSLRSVPNLRRHMPYPEIEVNHSTARERGITDGDWVFLVTPNDKVRFRARLSDAIHPRVVCVQHGWWQGCPELGALQCDPFGSEGSNINFAIRNESPDPVSGGIDNKSYPCEVVRA